MLFYTFLHIFLFFMFHNVRLPSSMLCYKNRMHSHIFYLPGPWKTKRLSSLSSLLSRQQCQGGWFWVGSHSSVQSRSGTCLTWLTVLSPTERELSSNETDPEECRVQTHGVLTYIRMPILCTLFNTFIFIFIFIFQCLNNILAQDLFFIAKKYFKHLRHK